MFTVEKVSPFLLHLPEDVKPDELFNCIAQVTVHYVEQAAWPTHSLVH
jgi:hypothetical protein